MEKKSETKHLKFFGIPKILPFLKHVRWQILMMVSLAIISSLVDIVIPQFQRYALDTFVGKGTMETIVPFVLCYVAILLFASLINYISCSQATIVEMKVNRELRQTGFRHLQTLSFSYFNQNSVGYIHARLMSDTGRIGGLVSWWLIDCTWRVAYLTGVIFTMFRMNARLAMMVLATVPLLVLLFSVFQKKLIHVNREVREVNSRITGNFNEGIMGAKTIKSLGIEEKMEQRFQEETSTMRRKSVEASRLRGLFAGTMNFASSVALAIVLWKGGYIALEEIGTFSVFMSDAQHLVPVFLFHPEQEVVLADTCIVHQHFDELARMRFLPCLDGSHTLCALAHIKLQQLALASRLFNQFERLLRFGIVRYVIHYYTISHLSQLHTNGSSNTTASAGN